jgi:uncharacterized membrane protein YfcA
VNLLMVALAGFVASLVDGALGMGFGPTSTTILLSNGLSPAAASTTVNLAKVAVGFAAGVSHWRFRNIDRKLVLQLAIPGCLGALIGVTVLSKVDGDQLKPYLALLLTLVGLRILLRFSRPVASAASNDDEADGAIDAVPKYNASGVEVTAVAGGVTNGLVGAWGPVVTPFLLHRGLPPRFAVGSVNTAEVAVAAVAAGSLIASLGGGDLDAAIVIAMLLGGIIAAPLAAWVIRFVRPQPLGLAVGALLLLTNARELANWQDVGTSRWWGYLLVVVLVTVAAVRARQLGRRTPSSRDVVETPATSSATQ